MVDDLVVSSEGRVFVFDGIEAVRAGSYYLFNFVAVHDLNVGDSLHLKKKFVASTSGGISCAALLRAKYGKGNAHFIQYFDKGLGNGLVSVIEGTGAAHPEKHFRCLGVGGHFGHGRNLVGRHVFSY